LSLREIGHLLFGRDPKVDPGGAASFEILEPLMNTNTMSYQDFVRPTPL
jgi:hypothetical protein